MVVRIRCRAGELQRGCGSRWMFREVVERVAHFNEKLVGHFSREAMPHKDALNDEIFAIGWHGVGRNKPAPLAQPVGKVIEGEARGHWIFQLPAHAGNATVAVIDNPEDVELSDLPGQIAALFGARHLYCAVALLTEA